MRISCPPAIRIPRGGNGLSTERSSTARTLPEDERRVGDADIAAIMGEEALAGHEIVLAVAVQIAQGQRVKDAVLRFDPVPFERAVACGIRSFRPSLSISLMLIFIPTPTTLFGGGLTPPSSG